LLVPGFGIAWAQTLDIGAWLNSRLEVEPELSVSDVKYQGVTFQARLAGAISGPLEFGLGAGADIPLSLVGNLSLKARADADTAGGFSVSAAGNGVLGKIAAQAGIAAYNVNPGHFEIADAFDAEARARLPRALLNRQAAFTLTLGGAYRTSRLTVLTLTPSLTYLSGSGLGAGLRGGLQLRRLNGPDDGVIVLAADLRPGGGAGYAAVGFEYRLNRQGLPLVRASLWLGDGTRGFWPGVRLALSQKLETFSYQLELDAEPYRTDALPYRASTAVNIPAGPGTAHFTLLATPTPDAGVASLTASGGYRLGF
jgi:hypothetical protein